MSSVIRSLMVKVGADLSEMQKGLAQASRDLKRSGKELSSAGTSLTKGLTAPLLGAAAGFGAIVAKSSETADGLQKMSDITGLSAERLQELKYAGANLGVELETITGAQTKLIKSMSSARDAQEKWQNSIEKQVAAGKISRAQADEMIETGDGLETAYSKLGIRVTDANGNLRDSKTVMNEAFTALGKMKSATDRDAIAMQIFGKSAMQLNPLIKAGGEQLAKLTDEAHKNGAIMSNENVTALDSFGDSMEALKLSLQGGIGQIAAGVTPALNKLQPVIQNQLIPGIVSFAGKIGDLITKFSEMDPEMQKLILSGIGITAAMGPVLSITGKLTTSFGGMVGGVGKAIKVISGGGGLLSAMGALIGPVGLVALGVGAVAGGFYLYNQRQKAVKDGSEDLVNSIKNTKKSYDDLKPAQVENISKSFVEAEKTKTLWGELQKLADENGNVKKANQERAKYIAGELTKATNTEIELVDGQIKKYGELKNSINNIILAQQGKSILEANQEEYDKIFANWKKEVNDVAALKLEIEERNKKYFSGNVPMSMSTDYQKETERLRELYVQSEADLENHFQKKDQYEKLSMAIQSNNYDEMTKIINNYGNDVLRYTETQNSEQAAKQEKALRKKVEVAKVVYEDIQLQVATGEGEVNQTMANSRLEDYKQAVAEYQKTGRAIPENLRIGFINGKPVFDKAVDEYSADTATKFSKIGYGAALGFVTGLNRGEGPIRKKVDDIFKRIPRDVNSYFEIHSPSRVFAEIGLNVGKGFAIGLEESRDLIEKTTSAINNKLIEEENKLQKQLADMDKADAIKREKEREEEYKKSFANLTSELAKAKQSVAKAIKGTDVEVLNSAKDDVKRIQDEITQLQGDHSKELADQSEQNLRDSLNNQLEVVQNYKQEYIDAVNEIQSKQDELAGKISEFGDLFTRTQTDLGDVINLTDQQKDIDTIKRYGEELDKLKAKGTPDELMSEILSMDVGDATKYMEKLLGLNDKDFQKYIDAFNEKRQLAKDIAARYYQDEWGELRKEFIGKMPEELSGIKDTMKNLGMNAADGVSEGFKSKLGSVADAFKNTLWSAMQSAKESLGIASPSKVMRDQIGKWIPAGIAEGITANKEMVNRAMADVTSGLTANTGIDASAQNTISNDNMTIANSMYAGFKSLISGLKSSNAAPTIVVLEMDGVEVGRATLPHMTKELKRLNTKLAEV